MRTPKALSYSGFSLWEKRPDEFYLKYLSERRPPKIPQERPAAAGASFDAQVKANLRNDLGLGEYQGVFDHYFAEQVEPQNRDWALEEGRHIFDCYVVSGFYAELLGLLAVAKTPPRFEFTVEATVNGVPMLCKPDAGWTTPAVVDVIHDWKVNGYCSKSTTSPHKCYRMCRDGYVAAKQSKSNGTEHKEFLAYQHGDLTINTTYLEAANPAWADQLSMYAWSLGKEIGSEFVLSVHQIVAKPMPEARPQLRVADYRARVKAEYQHELAARIKRCWDAVIGGHIFPDFSREDSDARCAVLDDTAAGLMSDGSSLENYFAECTREKYCG